MLRRLFEFLLSLQRVKLTSNTHFSFVWNYPVLIVLGALAMGTLGYWSYRHQAASPRKRAAMGIIRALLLMLVFILCFRPEIVVEHEERERSVVAVWIDNSASMSLEDPYRDVGMRAFLRDSGATVPVPHGQTRLNRYQLAVSALTHSTWLKSLAQTQDVAIYTGATHAQLIGTAHSSDQLATLLAPLQSATPNGEGTDIPAVLQEIVQGSQGERVSGLVLLTDGQTTEKGSRQDDAIAAAQRLSATIFAIPVGQTDEPFDLKLATVQLPENTFVRDPVAVKVHVEGSGIHAATGGKVTLYRKQGATLSELTSKSFTLDDAKKQVDLELIFKPEKTNAEKAEKFDTVAKVEPAGTSEEELTKGNNEIAASTNVLDAQINALYVDGYPRWEFRYLKNELIREKTVNVSTLLLSADDDFAQEADAAVEKDGHVTFPGPITRFPETAEELAKYDILFIGDVDPTYFSPTQQRLIIDFVGNGGGLGWIAGPAENPEAYKDTPLGVLLPIIPDELDPRARIMAAPENYPFNPVLTAAGRESNLFRFFDDPEMNVKQMAELPQMFWYKPVLGLAPAAEVLAVHPTRSQGGSPLPLIVTSHYKRGRTVFSGVADTWRWRRYTGEPLFQSYWLQMCRLLYRNKAMGQSSRVELAAEANRADVGTAIKVTLEIKDPTLMGQLPTQVEVLMTQGSTPGGAPVGTVALTRAPLSATGIERFEGTTTATQVGDFSLSVTPELLPALGGSVASYALTIEPPQREFEKIGADIESLGSLASKTRGKVVTLDKAEELARDIPDRSIPVLISNSEELWYKPIALVLVVLLATIEWLVRKNAGLI